MKKKLSLISALVAGATLLMSAVHVHAKPVPACPDVYDPVCGVDGITYSNAQCAPVGIACEGECPCPEPQIPRIEIGPQQVVILDQAGDTFQFTATWIGSAAPMEPLLIWESSSPEQVSVSTSGLATALVDNAYAVITATAPADVVHEPGFASVMIAELQDDLHRLAEDLVVDFSVSPVFSFLGPTGETQILATVKLTPATASLQPDDVAVFGDALGIRIDTITTDSSKPLLHLRGRGASLDEIYSELDVELGPSSLQLIAEAGARVAEARTKASPCAFQLQPIMESGSHFKIKMTRGRLVLLSYLVEGEMGLLMPSVGVRTRLVCTKELSKIPIWTPIPLLGLSIVPYLYTAVGGHIFVDTNRDFEIETPSASVSTELFGGLHFEDGELTFPADLPEPEASFDPKSLLFDFSDVNVSVRASAFIDAGVRLTLYPGTIILDDFSLASGTFLVSRIEVGREYDLPWQAHLGPEHPDYLGPTAEDFYAWIFWPIKEIGTGGGINFFLKLLGIGAIAYQPDGTDVLRFDFFHPRPTLTVDPDTVFVNGGPGSPSAASIQTELTPWQDPFKPNPIERVEVWQRPLPDGDFSHRFTGTDVTFVPGIDDVGASQLRSMAFNSTFGPFMESFPVASNVAPLTVVESSDIRVEPVKLSLEAVVSQTDGTPLVATNWGTETTTYDLEIVTGAMPVGIDDPGPITLAPGESFTHTFILECGLVAEEFDGVLYRLNAPGGFTEYEAEVRCTMLEIEPESLAFSMSVGESDTQDVTMTNRLGEGVDWFVANTGGLDTTPLEGALAAGESVALEVTATCDAVGTTETLVTFQAETAGGPFPFFQHLEVTIECAEAAARGWPFRLYDGAAAGFNPAEAELSPPLELDYRIDPPAGHYHPELIAPVALDGRVYLVFAQNDNTHSRIEARALDDGSLIWASVLPGQPLDPNPVVDDGVLYVPIDRDWNEEGDPTPLTETIYALSSETGGELWHFEFDRMPFADDAGLKITVDETTLFAVVAFDNFPDEKMRLHALDKATGQLLWMSEEDGGSLFGHPAVVDDVVAFSWGDGTAGYDKQTGDRLWLSPRTVSTWSWDLTGNDDAGLFYLPSFSPSVALQVLDARTGAVVGSFEGFDNGLGLTNPVLADGGLYQIAGWIPAELFRFDAATGSLESRLEIPTVNGDYTFMSLAGGVLYTTTNQFSGYPQVRAIDPATGAVLWESAEEAYTVAPLVVAGGKLLVSNAFGIAVYTSAAN